MREYIQKLTTKYPAISSIWLFGSRARNLARADSDWDIIAFADEETLRAMQRDDSVRVPGIDLMVVTDEDRFEQPWAEDGQIAKFGYLSVWRWNKISEIGATYFGSREQITLPATKLWPDHNALTE